MPHASSKRKIAPPAFAAGAIVERVLVAVPGIRIIGCLHFDLDVPGDRFLASTLLLQSRHPGSAFDVATSGINLQTKLAAVGLPFLEPQVR